MGRHEHFYDTRVDAGASNHPPREYNAVASDVTGYGRWAEKWKNLRLICAYENKELTEELADHTSDKNKRAFIRVKVIDHRS